jgi:hypothetical protein
MVAFRTTSIVSVKETTDAIVREFGESISQAAGLQPAKIPVS